MEIGFILSIFIRGILVLVIGYMVKEWLCSRIGDSEVVRRLVIVGSYFFF